MTKEELNKLNQLSKEIDELKEFIKEHDEVNEYRLTLKAFKLAVSVVIWLSTTAVGIWVIGGYLF